MKKITIILILFLTLGVSLIYSQNITSTLGASGQFSIKDGTTTFMSLDQVTGNISLSNNLILPNTSGADVGVIYKNGLPFLHDYGEENIFLGPNSGNFTVTGVRNMAFGSNSLFNNVSGSANTSLGYYSLFNNSSGSYNTATGYYSLYSSYGGDHNSAYGSSSLSLNGGSYNSAFG